MAITVKNFIADLAAATHDPSMIVTKSTDWIDILNAAGSELSPEIMFENTATVAFSTLDEAVLQVDMSSDTTYEGLYSVKTVYLEDSDGKRYPYDNWSFDKESRILFLDPKNETKNVSQVMGEIRPCGSYPNIVIEWYGNIPDTAGDASISLNKPRLALFRKICIREGISRILMDHLKLDRYRTLVGRANEYALLAIKRDMTAEIELDKAKLTNANTVKTF